MWKQVAYPNMVLKCSWTHDGLSRRKSGDRYPLRPPVFAPVTELVYVLVLEAKFCEFESRLGHQIRVQALYKSCLCVEPNNATTCISIGSKNFGGLA